MKVRELMSVIGVYEKVDIRLHDKNGDIRSMKCSRQDGYGDIDWGAAYERYGDWKVLGLISYPIDEHECRLDIHAELNPGDANEGYRARKERDSMAGDER